MGGCWLKVLVTKFRLPSHAAISAAHHFPHVDQQLPRSDGSGRSHTPMSPSSPSPTQSPLHHVQRENSGQGETLVLPLHLALSSHHFSQSKEDWPLSACAQEPGEYHVGNEGKDAGNSVASFVIDGVLTPVSWINSSSGNCILHT